MHAGENGDLQQRAANAYVVWPLAVLDLFHEPADATAWSRLHTRQAFVFGILATLAYLVLLALPLLLLIVVPPLAASTTAIVVLYALGIVANLFGACGLIDRARNRALPSPSMAERSRPYRARRSRRR